MFRDGQIGVFPSGMTAGSVEKDQKSDLSGTGKGESNPAGRPGSEKDMAGCALFLASRAAVYMNGQVSAIWDRSLFKGSDD